MGNRNLVLGCSLFALTLTVSPGQKSTAPPLSGGSQRPTSLSRTYSTTSDPARDSSLPFQPDTVDDPEIIRRHRLEQLFAIERQKKNMADSEKLVTLARELSADYEKPDPSEVSANQFNKVKEIEKLARRVKQRLAEQ